MTREKLLFIGTFNVSRSRTAEDMFENSVTYEVRSAGVKSHGLTKQQELTNWADRIFVMSDEHLALLRDKVNFDLWGKPVVVLGIPAIPEYHRGSQALINVLKLKLAIHGI